MREPTRWIDFLSRARPRVEWDEAGAILCLDPGETTGWAIFDRGQLDSCGQWATPTPVEMALFVRESEILPYAFVVGEQGEVQPARRGLGLILFEEYRVRGNKYKEHVGSEVVTIQHIGAIKVVAAELGIATAKQSAGMAKGFATDTKLRRWGLYQTGQRHANDAIRHGCHYLLFKHAPERREHAD